MSKYNGGAVLGFIFSSNEISNIWGMFLEALFRYIFDPKFGLPHPLGGVDKKRAACERTDPLLRRISFLLKNGSAQRVRPAIPSCQSAAPGRISHGGCVYAPT